MKYPVILGVPVLINESNSLFSISRYRDQPEGYFKKTGKLKSFVSSLIPEIATNLSAKKSFRVFAKLLIESENKPKVLVIGCGNRGKGMQDLLRKNIESVESDISLTPFTQIILDSHDIPFEDETFDGIIAQAVLEHVVDPQRCVAEMARVLKKKGLIYAEVPFMQQVHGGKYDFTRFTYLGLRRLFNGFEEVSSGTCAGSGTALAWSIRYFLRSLSANGIWRGFVVVMTATVLWPLKYFDYLLMNRPGALDASSCIYFMGGKSEKVLSDKELIKLYES